MDFDSIVTLIFILVFFVLPSLIRQIQARKKKKPVIKPKKKKRSFFKKKAAVKIKKKKPSFFNRISDQIQQFVQELEEQARLQKKAAMEEQAAWESLAEGDAPKPETVVLGEDADVKPTTGQVADTERGAKQPEPLEQRHVPETDSSKSDRDAFALHSDVYRYKSNPLQNAVVWSEILSKPVALRDDKPEG